MLGKNCVNEEKPVSNYHRRIKHMSRLTNIILLFKSLNCGEDYEVLFISLFFGVFEKLN